MGSSAPYIYTEDSELLFHSKSFKFIHLNVRNLLPNLSQLQLEFNNFDIIAPSETFLNKDVNDNDIKMHGFSSPFRRDRNRHGDGVCINVKETIFMLVGVELENDNYECVWFKINVKRNTFYSLVVHINHPTPNKNYGITFMNVSIK